MKTARCIPAAVLAVMLAVAGCRKDPQPASVRNNPPPVQDVRIDRTNLPIVFINTLGHDIGRDGYVQARMKIVDNPDGVNYGDTLAHAGQAAGYEGYISIKYRGHSTYSLSPKKPYNIKLTTADGSKRKAPLLGMGSDNNWALLAPYSDASLIRNTLSLSLARGYMEFVPETRFCELVLDGIYYGVHSLVEKVRRGDGRLRRRPAPGQRPPDRAGLLPGRGGRLGPAQRDRGGQPLLRLAHQRLGRRRRLYGRPERDPRPYGQG